MTGVVQPVQVRAMAEHLAIKLLQKAKRNGATIVGINPLAETGLRRFKQPQEMQGKSLLLQ